MDTRSRKRGIKASRAKLEVAMLAAGIKTQAELSDKIAEREGLSIPPKDTVNRAFRQQFVSHATIARIARTLLVEPESLLLQDDESSPGSAQHQTSIPGKKTAKQPLLGQFSLVLYCHTPTLEILCNSLQEKIAATIKSICINPAQLPANSLSADIATSYQADGVLTVRSTQQAQHLGIQLYLYFSSVEKLIWTYSCSETELRQQHRQIAALSLPFLYGALGLTETNDAQFESIKAQQDYLQARVLLNDHQSEINLKRAQTLLQSALEDSPDFARAHAALAESWIHESWRGNEKDLLEKAQIACDQAQQLASPDSYIGSVVAFLYRRSGRSAEAIRLCQEMLKHFPDNPDALSGLANAYQVAYQHDPARYPDALARAAQHADQATKIEPDNWKHFFDLGNAYFSNSQIDAAIIAFEQAARLNPNESALINLGTLYKCQGKLQKALSFYRKAYDIAPDSYVSNEFMASIYYYLEDFPKSVALKEKALDSFIKTETVGLHQMWGDLADAYRHTGQLQQAEEAYGKAIKIIERDELRGNATIMDNIYREYYLLALHQLDPTRFARPQNGSSEQQLDKYLASDLYPSTYVKLAQIQYIYNNLEQSRRALEKAAASCPVFIHHPDLKALKALYFKDAKTPS